jgi:hypothetical protein
MVAIPAWIILAIVAFVYGPIIIICMLLGVSLSKRAASPRPYLGAVLGILGGLVISVIFSTLLLMSGYRILL